MSRPPAELDLTDVHDLFACACDQANADAVFDLVGPPIDIDEPPDGVISPIDGRIVEIDDVDGLADLYRILDELDGRIYAAKVEIRRAFVALTEGAAKTRRVKGQRHTVRVEMPADNWDNSKLKEAWEAYPQFRDGYLRIERVAPKLREIKKLENTAGDKAFTTFRDMVTGANNGPTGTATIKIEE